MSQQSPVSGEKKPRKRPIKKESDAPRIQTRYIMLTYKTHIDKEKFREFVDNLFPGSTINIAHETGKNGDYEHSHAVVDLTSRRTIRDMAKFDYETIHPHFRPLFTKKAYKDSLKYISKEDIDSVDPEDLEPDDDRPFVKKVWECATLEEALISYVKKPSEVSGIIALYNLRPKPPMEPPIKEFRPWQRKLADLVNFSKSDRKIYWVVDPQGNSGKSLFCKHMKALDPKNTVSLNRIDTPANMTNLFLQFHQSGNSLKKVLIDIPRAYHPTTDFYIFIEDIKTGSMISTKYMGGELVFENHLTIVFSNIPPQRNMWTEDRLQVISLYSIISENKPDVYESVELTEAPYIDDIE